jgi:diguanylate cyclase (GGDEF)-like protein
VKAGRKTLFGEFRYIIFWSVTLTLLISSVVFAGMFFHSIREQRDSSLVLLAHTIANAAGAAIASNDSTAAARALEETIRPCEIVCRVTIRSGTGLDSVVLAQATKPCSSTPASRWKNKLTSMLSSGTVRSDIDHNGQRVGIIEITSNNDVFTSFLYYLAAVLTLCLTLPVLMARAQTHWIERRFATELASLSGMAHAARLEGDFTRRLPAFEIAEFNGLGQDFNALFSEIQARNAELALRQSHLETINRTLSSQAMCDALTGLANRACFSEQLEIAINKARTDGTRVGVLYIDNDHFKDVNDNFGHAAGDSLLVNVGKRLSGAVRESDLVARLGGDEFVILLAPVNGEDDLRHVSNKVLSAMSRKLRLAEREGVDIELGVSIGMAVFPDQANDASTLLRAADHAMYRAKRLGRGRACMYDPHIDAGIEDE